MRYNLKVIDAASGRVAAYVADIHASPDGVDDISKIHFYAAGGQNRDNIASAAAAFSAGEICIGWADTRSAGGRG